MVYEYFQRQISKFLKEKRIHGSFRDNSVKVKRRLSLFDRLGEQELSEIRQLVHEEFDKFKKRPGVPVASDARYPTMESLHEKINRHWIDTCEMRLTKSVSATK